MHSRPRAVTRHRRALAIGMGLSIVIHVAVLAFLRLGGPLAADADDRVARESADRYLAQRPIRVVRIASAAAATRAAAAESEAAESDAYPEEAAARRLAEADAFPAPRPSLSAGALDLRPVEGTSGGLESVALVSPAGSADGASADYNEGVVFEAASRAAKDGARREGRDPGGDRGATIGIGIGIVGPGGGDCQSGLPGGGVTIPPAIVDDFAGGFGGARGGDGRSAPGGLIGGALGTNGRNLGGGSVLGGGRPVPIGGIRIGGR